MGRKIKAGNYKMALIDIKDYSPIFRLLGRQDAYQFGPGYRSGGALTLFLVFLLGKVFPRLRSALGHCLGYLILI